MADETIYYAFEGDSSRLQKATQDAINSLTLYEDTVKNIQATLNSLMSSINDVVDWIKLLSSEMKNITKMASTASDAFKDIKNSSTQYANAMRSVADAQRRSASAAEESNKKVENSGRGAQNAKNGYVVLFTAVEQLSSAFNSVKAPAKETSNIIKEIGNVTSTAITAVRTFIGLDLAATFEKSAVQAMDYIENLNLFNVAMGDLIDQGKSFVNQMQEVYGLDPSNIMTYVGNFNQLASAIEMPAETAAILSTNMTKMATDVASVFNMDVVDVVENMKSGIMGMSRAVTKYGMDIRVTTLQQTALGLGITENVRNMSEANREGLRYITMVRQASNLSGDWAKTIESPSNQLRILKEQLTQLARAIGNLFLPMIAKVLPYINGFVMALREAVQAIADFFGFTQMDFGGTTSTIDKSTGALEEMGNQADKTAKKLQALKAPFDELNVIQEPVSSKDNEDTSSSEIMDPAIVAAINALNVPLENVKMKANEVRDSLLTVFNLKGESFQKALGKIKSLLQGIRDIASILGGKIKEAFTFNDNGKKMLETIKGLFSDIYDWLSLIIQDTKAWAEDLDLVPLVTAFNNLLEAIRNVAKVVGDKLEGVYRNVLLPLGKWTIESALPGIIQGIADALNWFAEHPDVAAIIAGIAAAIGMIVGVIQLAITVIPIISTVMTALNAIMGVTGLTLSGLMDAAAPVVGIVLAIIAAIAVLIVVIILIITHLDEIKAWIAEMKEKFTTFVDGVKTKLQEVKEKLEKTFAPVIETFQKIKDKFIEVKDTITSNIKIMTDKFKEIKDTLTKVFSALWAYFKKTIIDPVAKWFNEKIVKPVKEFYTTYIKPVVDKIKDYFITAFNWIGDKLYKIFNSIVTNIANLFIWAVNNIIGFFEGLVNGIVWAVNLLVKTANKVPGVDIDLVSEVEFGRIKYLASGGVVSGPTQAVIGEGKYDEAVVPLGDSPQMNDMLDRFADKVNDKPVDVNVYIGGKEWDAEVYKASQRGEKEVGATPLGGRVKI